MTTIELSNLTLPPSNDFSLQPQADNIAAAEANGLRVVRPLDNQLFIDIDSQPDFDRFKSTWKRVQTTGLFKGYTEAPSKSGLPKRHITVTLTRDMPVTERIALQAALGSDPMREVLSVMRVLNGDTDPILFFESDKPPTPQRYITLGRTSNGIWCSDGSGLSSVYLHNDGAWRGSAIPMRTGYYQSYRDVVRVMLSAGLRFGDIVMFSEVSKDDIKYLFDLFQDEVQSNSDDNFRMLEIAA